MRWFYKNHKKMLVTILFCATPFILFAQQSKNSNTSKGVEINNTYDGYLKPNQRLVIMSEIQGTIEKVYFEEGQRVQNGDVLVQISTTRLALQEDLARANYELAKSEFETEQVLFERQVSTNSKLDTFRTNQSVRKINLELARLDLGKSKINAPFAGVIKRKVVNVSEFVRSGQALVEIMDLSKVLVQINVPENEIRFMKPGQTVNVRVNSSPSRIYIGKVKTLGLEGDITNHTFPAEIIIENPEQRLLPGMSATVNVTVLLSKK